ncbi:unnamed protein product [Cylicocyclus nassatus]|uniref:carnosine N-methyltransferase n=1 Tax=Cylicocyclus nassatus TaxID=53992 RepID=A0AA36H608_CYLNA|nr:unnamed protein product [Cylicocyclus nassatus]
MKRKAEPDTEEMTSSKGPSTSKKLAPDTNNDFINETSRRARGNWACLAEKMRRTTRPPRRAKKSDRSLRSTLRLFSMTSSDSEAEDDVYSLCVRDSPFCIDIALPEDRTSLRHIAGFDNTGNVRIWPGGEALAYYLSIRPPLVSGKLVLELGAGLIGLPGFIAAIYATRVRITDGNEHSVASLRDIAKRNPLPNVEIELLRWGAGPDEKKFDLILAADCVFFAEYHEDLVSVLKAADDVVQRLREDGVGQTSFHPDVIAQVSALIWDTVTGDWTTDLLAFSSHAGRQNVNAADVALLMRRNKQLLNMVSKAADIDLGDFERPVTKRQRLNGKELGNSRRGSRARLGTKNGAASLRAARLTPLSNLDENSRSSPSAEKKRQNEDEVMVFDDMEDAEEKESFDKVALVMGAVLEGSKHSRMQNEENIRLSSMDILPTLEEPPLCASTPFSPAPTLRRSQRKKLDNPGIDSSAQGSSKVPKNVSSGISTPVKQALDMKTNKCMIDESTPSKSSICSEKKTASPDLFNTPLKENSSDGFDDLFDIPDKIQQAETSKNKGKNIGPVARSNDGWSVKFSEFSFFDDEPQKLQPDGEEDRQSSIPKSSRPTPCNSGGSEQLSTTPKLTNSAVSEVRNSRSNAATSKMIRLSNSKRRNRLETPTTTPKSGFGATKSDARKSAERVENSKKTIVLDEFDSDEEFFALKLLTLRSCMSCEASTSHADQCEHDHNGIALGPETELDSEIKEAEKILNAFLSYGLHGREVALRTMMSYKQLSPDHKSIILKSHNDHMRKVLECVDHNQEVLQRIVMYGMNVFGEEFAEKTWKIRQKRRPDPHYMGKVLSTLRQIVREWSLEGKSEREATFVPLVEVLRKKYPDRDLRGAVKIMVPGSGLGRLAFDLAEEGFTVEGNEYSMIMLMTSSFLLNGCLKENEHFIYPYTLDKSNCWSYADQTRPVYFPDTGKTQREVPLNFSMIAGDFLEVTKSRCETFDCVVTAWFIDTAKNVIDYIETIYRLLKPGGFWLNVGPLTYHYEDMLDEMSIELPYEEIMRIVQLTGFEVVKEERITSYYTRNRLSMLQNQYTCAFFEALKTAKGVKMASPSKASPPTEGPVDS